MSFISGVNQLFCFIKLWTLLNASTFSCQGRNEVYMCIESTNYAVGLGIVTLK